MMHTKRLTLREWKKEDLEPFYELNSNNEVMRYFPNTLTREESNALASQIQERIDKNGFCFWAVEEKRSQKFIGFVGLNSPEFQAHFTPCIEIGWRLHKDFWHKGYATEAAMACLEYGFSKLKCKEIVAFTSIHNKPSIAVMQRLGMRNTHQNFDHPKVPKEDKLCEHVLYKIKKV